MRHTTALRRAIAAITCIAIIGPLALPGSAGGVGTVSGIVFDDLNRNGTFDVGEVPFPGRGLQLLRPDGTWVAGGSTGSDGRYALNGVADGTYVLRMTWTHWVELRGSYVPTTTGSLAFEQDVTVAGGATSDLGLRSIVRSRTLGEPISSVRTPQGALVESYNDAVSATEVAAALTAGTLTGGEAPLTTIRLDFQDRSFCSSSYAGAPGSYSEYSAKVWVDWLSWVDTGDNVLFHEYGHAWAEYHEHVVQQDGSFRDYLAARGLADDARLHTNVFWDPSEMIAEDFRQLFGSPLASAHPQANLDIPPASEVSGLEDFLRTTYMQPSWVAPPPPPPGPTPTPDPPPSLTGLTVNPTPMTSSATATVNLSEPASVTIRVVASNGAVVRTLLSAAARPTGTVSQVWDRQADNGRKVKAGTYVLVVEATDSAGQTVQASTTFSVVDVVANRGRK